MAKAAKKSKATKKAPKKKGLNPAKDFDEPMKRPKQTRLPGMEDAPIKDLEEAAIEHSDILGEIRQKREDLKLADGRITNIMKKLGRTSYNRAGIKLKLREGKDSVSVQVKRHDHQAEQDSASGVPADQPQDEIELHGE